MRPSQPRSAGADAVEQTRVVRLVVLHARLLLAAPREGEDQPAVAAERFRNRDAHAVRRPVAIVPAQTRLVHEPRPPVADCAERMLRILGARGWPATFR